MPSYVHFWVLNMDSESCRIYSYVKANSQLTLLQKVEHPENRLKDSEITSDRSGHYATMGVAHGVYTQSSDPKEIQVDDFARSVAKVLDEARNQRDYEQLIIIALPHMQGLLAQHMNKHVKELVKYTIEKNAVHLTNEALLELLKTYIHAN